MIKDIVKQQLDINNPTNYIYKLKVMQNELDDLAHEFHQEWTYCFGCGDYAKVKEATETEEDGRIAVRCGKCKSLWKFKN